MSESDKTDNGFPVRVVPISRHWIAMVLEDDSIILQHRIAWVQGTGERVDLVQLNEPGMELARDAVEQLGSDRLAIRTLVLVPDGSVMGDTNAISPGGIPVEPHAILEEAPKDIARYFAREQKRYEAELAAETLRGS